MNIFSFGAAILQHASPLRCIMCVTYRSVSAQLYITGLFVNQAT